MIEGLGTDGILWHWHEGEWGDGGVSPMWETGAVDDSKASFGSERCESEERCCG